MIGRTRQFLQGVYRVWQRNRDVYMVTWKTNMIPPLIEPLLYLGAFGAGVGVLVKEVAYRGETISYAAFIAPGLMASGLMFHTFGENTYGTFVRLYYQKTFDAILATPISARELIVGELAWGMTKGFFANLLTMAAIALFGLMSVPAALMIVPFSLLAGFMFACVAIIFAATATRIDTLNVPAYLIMTPMFLFSGVFFPLDVMPPWARVVASFLPLTHVVGFMRGATLDPSDGSLARGLAGTIVFTIPALWLGLRLMYRRVIK